MAMTFFFFGTLRDAVLLECVIGRSTDHLMMQDGWIDGFAARRANNETFPVLIEQPDARLPGVIVTGLSEEDMSRIRFFEDTFYEASPVTVQTKKGPRPSMMFLMTDLTQATNDIWTFETWAERDRAVLRHMAIEFVGLHGLKTYDEADEHWEAMRERAERAVDADISTT